MGGVHQYKQYKGIFARSKAMRRKQDLASTLGIQKQNWGVTMHFSEIIKLQFGNKCV